jgi:hypothetical protein
MDCCLPYPSVHQPQRDAEWRRDLIPVRPPMPDTVRPDGGCPEAADGQSADRSGSSKTRLLLSRPALRVPSRTVTDADVAVCSRGSWSAHANAMGPGYLYCARGGFASDDICTVPMVSCSVDPSRRASRDSRERLWCRAARGGCGSNDLPRQGQNLDPVVVAMGNSGSPRQPATQSRLVADEGPVHRSPVLVQAVRDTPRR